MNAGDFAGMSTNERLFAAGILDAWDSAIESGDRAAAVEILDSVGLGSQAASIADTTLADPQKYGFSR